MELQMLDVWWPMDVYETGTSSAAHDVDAIGYPSVEPQK